MLKQPLIFAPAGRRSFLRAGTLGVGGLALPSLLRAEAAAGLRNSRKAVINIHLDGGPPQMDLIDPKPEAPMEIRGEFKSIPSAIPGLHLTELLPRLAKHAQKYVFLRSLSGAMGNHDAFQCQSGFGAKDLEFIGGRPAMGCALNRLLTSPQDKAPVFVDLMQGRPMVRNSARPGFLGAASSAFRPDISHLFQRGLEDGMKNELARRGGGNGLRLSLHEGLSVSRLQDRVSLLRDLDGLRRDMDHSGNMQALDEFTQLSLGILTSGAFAKAMDLSQEDPGVLARYTPNARKPAGSYLSMEDPKCAQKFLLARRLIEAGVRCVSISISDFDTHTRNFAALRYLGPLVDHALDTLVTDLEERGMLQDVMIIVWGEFGRTPRINDKAGRDHWTKVAMGIMAGGHLKTGQVIGATDKHAAEVTQRPVHYQDVIATLYHHLEIDARSITLTDTTGRPQYLVDIGQPIHEIL